MLNMLHGFLTGIGLGVVGVAILVPLAMWIVRLKPDPLYPYEVRKFFFSGLHTACWEESVFRGIMIGLAVTHLSTPWVVFFSLLAAACLVVTGRTAKVPWPIIIGLTAFFVGLLVWLLVGNVSLITAYVVATLVFGVGHVIGWGWRFAIVATVAGFVYGGAFILSGFNIVVPILVHAFTNTVWFGAMTGGEYK